MLSQRQTTIKNMILNRYLFEPWIKYRRRQHWTLYKLFVCNLYQPNVSMVNSESRKDNLEYRDGMPEKMTWINSLAIQMFGTMHTALPFMFIAKKTILPDHVWNSEFQQQVHQIYNIFIALDYIRKKWSAVVGSDNLRYTNSKKMHEFRYFYPQPITDFFFKILLTTTWAAAYTCKRRWHLHLDQKNSVHRQLFRLDSSLLIPHVDVWYCEEKPLTSIYYKFTKCFYSNCSCE